MLNLPFKVLKIIVEWFLYNKENDNDEMESFGEMDLTDYGADSDTSAPWWSSRSIHKKSFEIYEDAGNESEAATVLMDLDDKEGTHFGDRLSDHYQRKSYAKTPFPLVLDMASGSPLLLNLQQLYKYMHHLDTRHPVLATLAQSTRYRVEEVDLIVEKWDSHRVWKQHYRQAICEREDNLEALDFTTDEVAKRVEEIIRCKTIEAMREFSIRSEKELVLAALDIYQADPQPASGRSVGAHLLDVLGMRKGKGYDRTEQADWTEPKIDLATFSTTGDLLVRECKNHLWNSYLEGWELDPGIFEILDEAKGEILDAEGWDLESTQIEEVENDGICEDSALD